MYEMLDKHGTLAQNVDPVVTVAGNSAEAKPVYETWNLIMGKPAPKKEEPKKEEKKEEEMPADTGAEPMETATS